MIPFIKQPLITLGCVILGILLLPLIVTVLLIAVLYTPADYLRFLSTGGSDYPINELKIAGIDLTSPEVVKNAMKVFDETIDELAELIG